MFLTYDQFQRLVKDSLVLLDERADEENVDELELEEWLTTFHDILHAESERENEEV